MANNTPFAQTLEKGLGLVNTSVKSDINLKKLKGKEVGLNILLLGMAEIEANRIKFLSEAINTLEKDIFDPLVLENLSDDQKIERYSLALQTVTGSTNFIKNTVNKIDWNAIELNLLSLAESSDDIPEDSAGDSRSMTEQASALLRQLAGGNG